MAEQFRFSGIGRPVEEASLVAIEDAFYNNLGDDKARLLLAKRPGVYLGDTEGFNTNLRSEDPIVTLGMDGSVLASRLITRGVLDEQATESGIRGVYVRNFDIVPKPRELPGGSVYPIFANVLDVDDTGAKGGYQLLNEKAAVRSALGVNFKLPDADSTPRHKIKLGFVDCARYALNKVFLNDVRLEIGTFIDLAAVDELDPAHRQPRQ